MYHNFKSDYSTLLGYPEPTEKWTENDLWEWVNAGKPGNPPWNPQGLQPPTLAEREAIVDASGNRAIFEAYKAGKAGSFKAVAIQAQKDYGARTQAEYKKAKTKRMLLTAGAVGLGILALMGMS